MRSIVCVILCLSAVSSFSAAAEAAEPVASGVDLFVEACRWQGINPTMIRTGYAEFELAVTAPPASQASLDKEIETRRQAHRALLANTNDSRQQAIIEKATDRIPEAVRARNLRGSRSRVKVLFDGNDVALGKRRWEVINLDPETENWHAPILALRHGLMGQGEDDVVWESLAQSALVSNQPWGVPLEIQTVGRMQGLPSKVATAAFLNGSDPQRFRFSEEEIANFKAQIAQMEALGNNSALRLTGEVSYDPGAMAFVVESSINTSSGSQPTVRYWIDASRGHICPLIQLFGPGGDLTEEWKSSEYFLHEESGLWFPKSSVHTEYAAGGVVRQQTTCRLDPAALKINQSVSAAEFSLELPAKAVVLDSRAGKPEQYLVNAPLTLDLPEGRLDLSAFPQLQKPGMAVPPTKPSWKLARIGGLAVVIAALVGIFWHRRNARRGGLLACLVLSSGIILGQGCSWPPETARQESDVVAIEPATLDFGRVRQQDQPLEVSFTIGNRGPQPLEIKEVRSGCGCTVAELPASVVAPRSTLRVPVKVSTHGRLGQFSNRILIDVVGRGEPISLPLQGMIVQDIWYDGQVIRCSAEEGAPTAETTFEVCTVDWPTVAFDWTALDKGITVEEISRVQKADQTVISFHLVMEAPTDQYATEQNVVLKPQAPQIQPLTIPAVCYRPALRDRQEAVKPKRVSLGVLARGTERRFRLFGSASLVASLTLASVNHVPADCAFELQPAKEEENAREVTFRIGTSAPLGLLETQIVVASPDGQEYAVTVQGLVREDSKSEPPAQARSEGEDGQAEPSSQVSRPAG